MQRLFNSIIGCFLDDNDIMDVAFSQTCRGNLHELRPGLERVNVFASQISHAGPQASHKLVYRVSQWTTVGHTPDDPLRHQLLFKFPVFLKIPVSAPFTL